MSNFCCEKCGTAILDSPRGYTTSCPHYQADPDPVATVGRIVFDRGSRPRTYTDAELTEIYNRANGIAEGKAPPITTQRVFNAMRAMRDLP